MLIKEYRIPMPLSVQQYRIAQLYMIQKKSREESQGTESGVEIIENQPYTDGPGGDGQHTQKVYHIGKHIPGWLAAILPKDALIVEEEAWNAYPYTRTRYTCPFVEKFSIDIETRYYDDAGHQNNVFNLSPTELRSRVVDDIDIVKEQVSDYKKEEDPKLFKSKKTGYGPLTDNWLSQVKNSKPDERGPIMCAYKMCKVEFKYWGMQSKIEKFIHDTGLRKVMLRAHKQAWCWQDEWYGLTIEDIRRLEKETQLALQLKFGSTDAEEEMDDDNECGEFSKPESPKLENALHKTDPTDSSVYSRRSSGGSNMFNSRLSYKKKFGRRYSSSSMFSVRSKQSSNKDGYVDVKLEGIRRHSTDVSSDDDEFFDAEEEPAYQSPIHPLSGLRLDSEENLTSNADSDPSLVEHQTSFDQESISDQLQHENSNSNFSPSPCKITTLFLVVHGGNPLDATNQSLQSKQSDIQIFQTTLDSVMDAHYKSATGHVVIRLVACSPVCNEAYQVLQNISPLSSESNTMSSNPLPSSLVSLFATSSSRYNDLIQSLASNCNSVYNAFLNSPEGRGFQGQVCIIGDATGGILAYDLLCKCTNPNRHINSQQSSRRGSSLSNHEDDETCNSSSLPSSPCFRVSPPTLWDHPTQVHPRRGSATPILGGGQTGADPQLSLVNRNTLYPASLPALHVRRLSDQYYSERSNSIGSYTSSSTTPQLQPQSSVTSSVIDVNGKLDFEVSEFFVLGSSLAYVLALRQLSNDGIVTSVPAQPACHQMYNLFYAGDPSSARIEPLLDARFTRFLPINVANYDIFPLGDGKSLSIGDLLSTSNEAFSDVTMLASRRPSEWSISSGYIDNQSNSNISQKPTVHDHSPCDDDPVFKGQFERCSHLDSTVAERWWGEKRIDFALFYPEVLSDFPTASLPHLFHASFWESTDFAAFVLRQIFHKEHVRVRLNGGQDEANFVPALPREKWAKKRTQVKLRNITSNHRAKDGIALENSPQTVCGKFMYGPLDMVTLNGEKIDIHIMTPPPASEWVHLGTEVTNNHGKITFTIPEQKRLGLGIYSVKMVVRGDHSFADSYLAVLPPQTDCVIFSIDGSFTASVSIMGSDPKVRPGAVDVVRIWQDLGYVIIYVTARPDMQKQRVATWLAQHNFPHGLVWFSDGLTHDPMKQKTILLKNLMTEYKLNYSAAYGSSKDIAVYSQLGLAPHRIYVVGKATKKQTHHCSWLSDGYSVHLNELVAEGLEAAKFNAQILLRKGCFGLPGSLRSRSLSGKKRKSTKNELQHH
uniref:Membrane-associated phosphatidylinositol transfer protein 3 n=1 Tax=Phallusia mammillata TaxID=59560 RepID=A0A6F9DPJ2_9ASCI|nr:membrane-associated phosphatidylinositol transfer protein 3 [Phallusia mammillata]